MIAVDEGSDRGQGDGYEAVSNAARRIGCSAEYLRQLGHQGQLELFRLGRKLLIRRGAADRLVRPVTPGAA